MWTFSKLATVWVNAVLILRLVLNVDGLMFRSVTKCLTRYLFLGCEVVDVRGLGVLLVVRLLCVP